MRPWLVWSTLVLAAAASPAAAETALDKNTDITVDLGIPKMNGVGGTAQSMLPADYTLIMEEDSDIKRDYLNQARCLCDRSAADGTSRAAQYVMFRLEATEPPTETSEETALEVFAGEGCDTANQTASERERVCASIKAITVNEIDDDEPYDVFARVGDVLASGTRAKMPRTCTDDAESQSQIYVLSNAGGSAPFDETNPHLVVKFDLTPPTMPQRMTAIGLENALRLSWDATGISNLKSYQALCIRADLEPARTKVDGSPDPSHTAEYSTTDDVCDLAPAALNAAIVDGSDPAGIALAPERLKALDPNYVCGRAGPDAASIDLAGLENGVSYWVVVMAIDTAGNYHAMFVPKLLSPQPVTDFWEDVNEENPDINGGFCVSQVGGDGSAASAVLVLGAIGVALRRRRRRRSAARAATLTALAALAFAPTAARAQDYDPYWIDSDAEATSREPVPEWHLGLRVGPYHPAVDDSFMSDPGPFRRMFGPGYNLVPQLDLHRLFTLSSFQLGVGFSVGYYRKSAEVYQADTDPMDPDRPRVTDAINTFQMVPLAATVLARLPILDDRWGIPVVPYVRGGLAYNVWWVRTPTDEIATSCSTCEDKALGASAGLVGAVGIAIRGERIDPEASHSMKNGGVEHAGFYAELETAWVDGFGSGKRMSLGDTTWYAGVDFEF